jgi:hypothetical protein
VLLADGFSAVPRWTLDPAPGVAEYETTLPLQLAATLRRTADELSPPPEPAAAGAGGLESPALRSR